MLNPSRYRLAPIGSGAIGTAALGLILYTIQALGMQSVSGPVDFFLGRWYFELPLLLGFGFQVGLIVAIRRRAHLNVAAPVATGGSSTASMIACCLHNFAPLISLLGIGSFAASLAYYQDYLFAISLLIMLIGTGVLLKHYRMIRQSAYHVNSSSPMLCH